MTKHTKLLLASTALFMLVTGGAAQAETVRTQTVVHQADIPNMEKVDFTIFDINNDGILSMSEVGKKLFRIFDTDGNMVLDNIEFHNKKMMTIIPMEKSTLTLVDYDNDGVVDKSAYEYDTFIQQSRLSRFDEDKDGLSPVEFTGNSFLELDDDKSKAIELEEWEEAYTVMVHPKAAEQERYQQ